VGVRVLLSGGVFPRQRDVIVSIMGEKDLEHPALGTLDVRHIPTPGRAEVSPIGVIFDAHMAANQATLPRIVFAVQDSVGSQTAVGVEIVPTAP